MIPVALSANSNFYPGLLLALSSILANSASSQFQFHILDGGLKASERDELSKHLSRKSPKSEIIFHTIDLNRFEGVNLMYGNAQTYARLLLPEILPSLDEMIYCDADVLYGVDMAQLWDIPLGDRAVAAAPDPIVKFLGNDCRWVSDELKNSPYFNAGILKINLAYWRQHRIMKRALEMARREPENFRMWDQSLLNFILRDSVVWMDPRFNYLLHESNEIDHGNTSCEGKNIHYVSSGKPWLRHSSRRPIHYWRKQYRRLISVWPSYQMSFPYWGEYVWGDLIMKSSLKRSICFAIKYSGLHRMIPGLSLDKINTHLQKQ